MSSGEPDIADETSSTPLFSIPNEWDTKSINLDLTPPARQVEITATDFRFTPNQLVASPGELLIVVLRNAGTHPHSIVFELPDGRRPGLEAPLRPGERAQLSLRMPASTGRFAFYCPIGDHRQQGMHGIVSIARPR